MAFCFNPNPVIANFIGAIGGSVVILRPKEYIIKAPILNLLQTLSPIENFNLRGQRVLDEERVIRLSMEQEAEFEKTGQYGIVSTMITLGQSPHQTNNPYGIVIVDGQHRVAIFRHLAQYHQDRIRNDSILIKIYRAKTETELRDYFVKINRNYVPVSQYDLNDTVRSVVDRVRTWFNQQFDGGFFKTSTSPQRPNINLNQAMTDLSNSRQIVEIINHYNGNMDQSVQDICDRYWRYNSYLSSINPDNFATSNREDEKSRCRVAKVKCEQARVPLYLGMVLHNAWVISALS